MSSTQLVQAANFEFQVVAGIVHVPILGETYTAVRGQGAYCNDEKLSPSTVQGRSKTVCVTLQSEFRGLTVMMKNSPHPLYKVGPKLSVLHCSQRSGGLL